MEASNKEISLAQVLSSGWQNKIDTLKITAKANSNVVSEVVERALSRGIEHMKHKDFREFDCECKEQYVFQEAEHLIEQYGLLIDSPRLTDGALKNFVRNEMSKTEFINEREIRLKAVAFFNSSEPLHEVVDIIYHLKH